MIDRLPKGRDFTSLVTLAPGANNESRSGGISIDGASSAENRYFIDGTDTTNLRTGLSGKTLLPEFIDEVQVKSSGYQAEFGGATGGVVNVVTKSGTNSFRGDIGTYFAQRRDVLRRASDTAPRPERTERVGVRDPGRGRVHALGAVHAGRRADLPEPPVVLRRLHAAAGRHQSDRDVPLERPDQHL